MGYDITLCGAVDIMPPFTDAEAKQINKELQEDPECYTRPHPEGYCEWYVNEHGGGYVEWNGNEKFTYASGWLKWFIDEYVAESGRTADGEIECEGEDGAKWLIRVKDNKVYSLTAAVQWINPVEITNEVWDDYETA